METRRLLDEVILRYKLHPELIDIFVEGEPDRKLFNWYLCSQNYNKPEVYKIDTVDINGSTLATLGLTEGARNRLIALSKIFETEFPNQDSNVLCIVDKDYDTVFFGTSETHYLFLTDYTSLEMYFFNDITLQKYLIAFLGNDSITGTELITILKPILKNLFLIRLAKEQLKLCIPNIKFQKYLQFNDGLIEFSDSEYCNNLLTSNGLFNRKQEFRKAMDEFQSIQTGDYRCKCHGHDFVNLMGWYVKMVLKAPNEKLPTTDILLLCVDCNNLMREPLFIKLENRLL